MSRVCSVCSKSKMAGNKVSHSNRKTCKTYNANLQKVRVKHSNGSITYEYVCTRCLRSGLVERA
ncbi:MAG: 50S ribosomal protein L28 [Christensenellales bacterium]